MKKINFTSINDDYNYIIYIGENAQENWNLIDKSGQNDLWFHVENNPSCHIVLNINSRKKVHKSVINYCAKLCKENSKKYIKNSKKCKIIYTQIKNVSKSDKVGSVNIKNTKVIKI